MKTTIIHHSADVDGIFCREIARKFLPDAELIGWDFKDDILAIPEGQIYVLDLPVDRPFGFTFDPAKPMNGFWQTRVTWIDHHKTSIDTHPQTIPGYRIDGVAACRLAWQWFKSMPEHATPNFAGRGLEETLPSKQHFIDRQLAEPLAVRLAGEYDVWDKRDPDAEKFQFGLRSQELTATDWMILLDSDLAQPNNHFVQRLLTQGGSLQCYQQHQDANTMHRSFIHEWQGLKFLTLTIPRCNSLTFAARDLPETGHDALMGLYNDGTHWHISMYHAKHRTDLDLSVIAKQFGGGGHRGACGFKWPGSFTVMPKDDSIR